MKTDLFPNWENNTKTPCTWFKAFGLSFSCLIIIALYACDGGLSPKSPDEKPSISGRITYAGGIGAWPKDSVVEIRVVAFKHYPPDSIIKEITSGNAYFSAESLPKYVESEDYSLDIPDAPAELQYIVVAQRYGSFLEWKAIGVYTLTGDNTKPSPVFVEKNKPVKNIDITVDFKNLPPQPFE